MLCLKPKSSGVDLDKGIDLWEVRKKVTANKGPSVGWEGTKKSEFNSASG